jgi:superfamily I DNA/RNA helicase
MSSLAPTKEQEAIVAAARQDRNIAINAFAGTGKTTTLGMVAEALPRKRILYLAFNKAIAEEAKRRMPSNVDARTFHSLAFRAMRPDMKRLEGRLHGGFVADLLGLSSLTINNYPFYPSQVGRAVLGTVFKFCLSKDPLIEAHHVVPPHEMLPTSVPDSLKQLIDKSGPEIDEYKRFIKESANTLWDRMSDRNSNVPITHDTYVKQWALQNPKIDTDVILFDEAQDASGLFIDIVGRQRHAQRIWVGDRHQQIYEWRGAINALDLVDVNERLYLTESWRFHQRIADAATIVLRALGETKPLIGRGGSSTNADQAFLCRTNIGALQTYVDLVERHNSVRLDNAKDLISLIDDCEALMNGRPQGSFALFKDWKALVEHAQSPQGGDLRPLVDAIERYSCQGLRRMLERGLVERASITVATIHRAKGLEWDKVTIIDDWARIKKYQDDPAEWRLLYVAITRARKDLVLSDVVSAWLGALKRNVVHNSRLTHEISTPLNSTG